MKYLYIPRFNTNLTVDISSIFGYFTNLEILSINSMIENDYIDFTSIFDDIPSNLLYCINEKTETQKYNFNFRR